MIMQTQTFILHAINTHLSCANSISNYDLDLIIPKFLYMCVCKTTWYCNFY